MGPGPELKVLQVDELEFGSSIAMSPLMPRALVCPPGRAGQASGPAPGPWPGRRGFRVLSGTKGPEACPPPAAWARRRPPGSLRRARVRTRVAKAASGARRGSGGCGGLGPGPCHGPRPGSRRRGTLWRPAGARCTEVPPAPLARQPPGGLYSNKLVPRPGRRPHVLSATVHAQWTSAALPRVPARALGPSGPLSGHRLRRLRFRSSIAGALTCS